jgi:hypothetical protein
MHIIDDTDNIYSEGTIVRLKIAPSVYLMITKYQQRVYFCTSPDDQSGKLMPYYERELEGSNTP